jgi:hypothetical protein
MLTVLEQMEEIPLPPKRISPDSLSTRLRSRGKLPDMEKDLALWGIRGNEELETWETI